MTAISARCLRRSPPPSLATRKTRQGPDNSVTETCDGPASVVTEPCDEPYFSRQFLTRKRDDPEAHRAEDQALTSAGKPRKDSDFNDMSMIPSSPPSRTPTLGPPPRTLNFRVSFFTPAFFCGKPPQTTPAAARTTPARHPPSWRRTRNSVILALRTEGRS
jgi:hypothetical protein